MRVILRVVADLTALAALVFEEQCLHNLKAARPDGVLNADETGQDNIVLEVVDDLAEEPIHNVLEEGYDGVRDSSVQDHETFLECLPDSIHRVRVNHVIGCGTLPRSIFKVL